MDNQTSTLPDDPEPKRKIMARFSFLSSDFSNGRNKFALVYQVIRQCIRLVVINRCGTQAAALAYHTLFGVVPLAIVMLMVFQMFPAYKDMGDKVKQLVYNQFQLKTMAFPATEEKSKTNTESRPATDSNTAMKTVSVADKIDEITSGYISNLNAGAITFIGGLLTIWAAIGLLTTIERSFNNIWGVSKNRDFLHRIVNYWSLLTLGPLLLGVGIYLSTHPIVSQALKFGAFRFIQPVFGFIASVLVLFSLYMFLPNASVRWKSALIGAILAAILWTAAKLGFGFYIQQFIPYQAVYGIMGLIPLAVFWIYVVWWIVLIGLQLTYAAQHIHSLDKAEKLAKLRQQHASFIATEQAVIQIMQEVLAAFEDKNRKPITSSEIAEATTLQADFIERILDNMTNAGLLCRTMEPIIGYVPSTDGANITLADISAAVEKSSFKTQSPKLQHIIAQLRGELAKYKLKDIL